MTDPSVEHKVVTRKVAAEMYSVSEATLRRAVAMGTLRAKTLGGRLRFRVEDLEDWYASLPDA